MSEREHHSALLGIPDLELRLRAGDATHQHYKGGLYRRLPPVKDSVTGKQLMYRSPRSPVIVYEHCYPYERELWARSEAEWDEEVEWYDGVRRPRLRELGVMTPEEVERLRDEAASHAEDDE